MKSNSSKITFLFLFLFLNGLHDVFSQSGKELKKSIFNHNKVFEDEFGYIQAMHVDKTIFISGIAAKGEMETAIVTIYERVSNILAFYDLTLNHVVKETIYTTQFDALVQYKDIRKQFYKNNYPTSTWVQVERLYSKEAIIEIEFTAISKRKPQRKKRE
jgi:enamine deaminase RidA (YjgF/YER057c/UK114 family)